MNCKLCGEPKTFFVTTTEEDTMCQECWEWQARQSQQPDPSQMPLVYVAGAYRANTEEGEAANIHQAALYATYAWNHGYAVISPHLNTKPCWDISPHPLGHEAYIRGDLRMLRGCDELHVLPGWENSSGTKQEIALAIKLNIKIVYITQEFMEHLNYCGEI